MSFSHPRLLTVLVFLICLIVPIYSNTLHAPWQYDDHPNILYNPQLHLTDFDADAVRQTFFTQAGRERFYRPVPNFSFALNWFVGRDNPFGYHLVNIVIHVLTAFFLYLTILQLFRTPALCRRYSIDDAVFVSLISAMLWAVNPIQTQTVTYIVQRMAQMAALFYVSGMFFYLKARLSSSGCGRWYFLPAALMFCCAVFSKENAVMFPVVLFFLELLFLRRRTNGAGHRFHLVLCCLALGAGLIGVVMFAKGDILFFLKGYSDRPFSLLERTLTEPRIVLFYLSQIFYPLPSRLSISHDVLLSRSLFSPWTTFPAIMLTGLLVVMAVSVRRRYPLLAFAILFYFVNHSVESTIIPLELIFEHRNYLPSLFLFVPVTAVFLYLLKRYASRNRLVFWAVGICLLSVIIFWGRFSYERNSAWGSIETLWYDASRKAPNQPGPLNNLAAALGWGKQSTLADKELAVRLLTKAITLEHPRRNFRSRMYDNLGTLLMELGDFAQAETAYQKAIDLDPNFLKPRHNLARFLARTAQWQKALAEIESLLHLSGEHDRAEYYQTQAYILLWMNLPDKALASLQKALIKDPYNSPLTLYYTGSALSRTGEYARAEWFYKLAQFRQPVKMRTFLLLIENSVRAGERSAAEQYARILFSEFDVYDIFKTLKTLPEPGKTIPVEKNLVTPVIKTVFYAIAREAEEKGILPE